MAWRWPICGASIWARTPGLFWRSPDPLILSVVVNGDNLIVGTGDEGKIYSVTPDGDWASVADCEESKVLSLHKAANGGDIWLATGDAGKAIDVVKDILV